MLAASIIRFSQQQRTAQLQQDLRRFVKPLLTKGVLTAAAAADNQTRTAVTRRCPVCNDDVLRDPARLDCHISFHHQSIGELCTSQAGPLARYNAQETRAACASSLRTDVVLILDLANLELSGVLSHDLLSGTARESPLGVFFSKYSVTCVLTHELVVPIASALAPTAFATLVDYHSDSQLFTLFVSNGLDKGDFATGTFLQSLLSMPGADGTVFLMTNDAEQRTSLQLLHDARRLRTLPLAKTAHQLGVVLDEGLSREFLMEK